LFVISLAPVEPHDLRHHLAPDAAELRRIGKAAMAHPPVEPEQIGELPDEMRRERDREARPHIVEDPPGKETDGSRPEKSDGCEPPGLIGALQGLSWLLRACRETIARAAHGLDEPIVPEFLERLAKPADVHVDRAFLDVDVAAPNPVEQLVALVHA